MTRAEQETLFNVSTTALHIGLDLDTESERCRWGDAMFEEDLVFTDSDLQPASLQLRCQ